MQHSRFPPGFGVAHGLLILLAVLVVPACSIVTMPLGMGRSSAGQKGPAGVTQQAITIRLAGKPPCTLPPGTRYQLAKQADELLEPLRRVPFKILEVAKPDSAQSTPERASRRGARRIIALPVCDKEVRAHATYAQLFEPEQPVQTMAFGYVDLVMYRRSTGNWRIHLVTTAQGPYNGKNTFNY